MDYEKAYKEALERARMYYSNNLLNEVFAKIFPELEESEDERIRKAIFTYLHNELTNTKQLTPRTNEFESWLAWLERQNVTDPDVKMNHPLYLEGFDVGKEVGEIIKEQKSTECLNLDELSDRIKAEFESFRNLLKKKGLDYEPADNYWESYARLFLSSAQKYMKPAERSEEVEDAMRDLETKIASAKKSWEGVDVDEYMDEVRPEFEPLKPVDLEEEITRTYRDGSVTDTSDIDHVVYENIAHHSCYEDGFKAGAEWMKSQEFTHIEPSDDAKQAAIHYMEDCQEVDDFIRKGIDDIAERYFQKGAEWMAGQGVKATATVGYYNQSGLSILPEPSIKKLGYMEGDELILSIRKK